MPSLAPPLRVGPYDAVSSAPVPDSGTWFLGVRAKHGRAPSHAWIRVFDAAVDTDVVLAHHGVYEGLGHAAWPRAFGAFPGARAQVVRAPLGPTLAAAHAAGVGLPAPFALQVVLDVVEALIEAHARSRAHGAVALDRITVDAGGRVTLWGLAPGRTDLRADHLGVGALILDLWLPGARRTDAQRLAALDVADPGVARLTRRLLEPDARNGYPTLHPVRREVLAALRRVGPLPDRAALGDLVARALPAPPPSPAPERPPMAKPPSIHIPTPHTGPSGSDETTTRPAPKRRALPQESVPVVRPSVGAYVPTATVSQSPTPIPAVRIRATTEDIPVVSVEFDTTDPGVPPQPLGLSMPTDDMPLPTPNDVFGNLRIDGDPLDAPSMPRVGIALPDPVAVGTRNVTAVPGTDPGSDASIDDLPEDGPRRSMPQLGQFEDPGEYVRRTPSLIERVAQGLLATNAVLAALWLAVRAF